jgi:hypothetical protein
LLPVSDVSALLCPAISNRASYNDDFRVLGLDHKVGSVPRMMWFSGNATQHYVYATDFMVKAI